ncbi:OmpA family protein [Spirosoma sordidisoli]|uniref:Flagellar motor protein MotB n=1 Tax=Spirosoma sordidisoli TaxID=2502893 RepID=A0A4V1RWD4_9BACT|nr:OmpA family protein [Spirosoma sordidisoli]RYC69878.1 flagellar motor protein MotB [Spirosoma sordidisoli]
MFTNKTPWIILLVLWMIGSTWWHVCKIKQLCVDDLPSSTTLPTVAMPSLIIADGDRFRLDMAGNFSFAKSGANANMSALGGSLDSLTAYLKTTGRTMEIRGYYASTEANTSSFPNLGLARAEGIKQYLVQQGVPAASLTTKGVLQDDLTFTAAGDSLYGGLNFVFDGADSASPVDTTLTDLTTDTTSTATAPATETVAAGITEAGLAAKEKFTTVFEPIDLYFPLGEANYIKTPETAKFFKEAVAYLSTHKEKKLVLTGYTDNSGPDDVNLRLSRDRANQVKARLRQSGISPDQIVTDAKGEANPKASNDTREGRKANRRVMVVVK